MDKYIKIISRAVRKLLKEYQYVAERSAMNILLVEVPVLIYKEKK